MELVQSYWSLLYEFLFNFIRIYIPKSFLMRAIFASSNIPFSGGPYRFIYSIYSYFTFIVKIGVDICTILNPLEGLQTLFDNSSIFFAIACDMSNNFVARLLKNVAGLLSIDVSQQHGAGVLFTFETIYDGIFNLL